MAPPKVPGHVHQVIFFNIFKRDKEKTKTKTYTNTNTNTKTNTMTNTKTKTMTYTFREHPQRALETCDLRLDT